MGPWVDAIRRSVFGLMLLATGRARGFACFGTDTSAYLASLAPLLAFTLVAAALEALRGQPRAAAALLLLSLCQILGPAVIADPFCRRWQREAQWALYANILNWTPFLLSAVILSVLVVARLAVEAGVGQDTLAGILLPGLLAYMLWFQWFVTRGALALSRRRTAALVGTTILFGVLLVLIQLASGTGAQTFTLNTA